MAYKKGDRSKLKNYKNVEYKPLIEADEDTPIIELVPPPPLHLLLLGPVNDIIKKLQQLHPPILKEIEKLHIQRSKYQGKNFEGKYASITILDCIVLYCIVRYCNKLNFTLLYFCALCCTLLCCVVIYCNVLYCTVLNYNLLY